MKKLKKLAMVLLGSMLVFTGCGQSSTEGTSTETDSKSTTATAEVPTITIWGTGGQEVREAIEAIATAYNNDPEYNKKAKVAVQFVVSGTSEQSLTDRLAAAYEAGQKDTDFNLLAVDDSMVAAIKSKTSEDFFKSMDTSKISNYKNLKFKTNIADDIFIPYRGTSVYLAYNSDKVKNPPKTADELYAWIKANPGQFAYNTPNTGGSGFSFVSTSIYNQLPEEAATSADTKWMTENTDVWNKAFETLKALHPYLYETAGKVQYPNKNAGTLELLANQEINMCPAFVNMVLEQKSLGVLPDSIELTEINPSFFGGLAGLLMPEIGKSDSGYEEAAYSVIDYFLSAKAQAIDWNTMYAFPLVDPTTLEGLENEEWLKAADFTKVRYVSIGGLATEINTRWTEEVGVLAQ